MLLRWPVFACIILLVAGCTRPAADPALRAGDVVRPEIAFAPKEPWPAGADVTLGMLLLVDRAGSETRYLRDEEVNPDQAVMRGRVTFLKGDSQLGDPLEVSFVRDC
jgi:hypothetical protein